MAGCLPDRALSRRPVIAALLFVAVLAGSAGAACGHGDKADARPAFDEKVALAQSQAAVGRVVEDHIFATSDGDSLHLAGFRGRPVIVNLVYTACVHTCPLIVQSLYRSVRAAQQAFGVDRFTVVTIGFDVTNDTPQRMRAYQRAQGIDLPNWRFLSADAATVRRLTEELGFRYVVTPGGFDHLAQVSILDSEGRVYRQVYGSTFDPPIVVEPLKELMFGRRKEATAVESLLGRIRLLCTVYDPAGDRYRFDYSLFIGLAIGALSLGGVAVILVRSLLRDWRPRRGT